MSPFNPDEIRVVAFDAVGTLIFPEPGVVPLYHSFGVEIGSTKSVEEIHARFARAYESEFEHSQSHARTNEEIERERWRRLVSHVFDDVPVREAQFEVLWKHFADPSNWSLYPDAAETWQALSVNGFTIAIASNFDSRLRPILEAHLPLASCPHVCISTEIGWSKPHPRFFQMVQRRLAVRAGEILLVGDSIRNDIRPAIDSGWQAIHIDRKGASDPSNTTSICDLANLVNLLKSGHSAD